MVGAALLGATMATAPAAVAGAGAVGVLAKNLLGLGIATAPVTAPVVTDILEGMTPGQGLTQGRAGALGVAAGDIEKLGENGFVGTPLERSQNIGRIRAHRWQPRS